MFSSLSQSLSNLYQNATFSMNLSPQAILASYLSASLAEFLQVDSHLIETRLLTDQRVTLYDIQLQPRTVVRHNTKNKLTITWTGTIQKMEFRWEWNTQTYISNVRLKIVGVDLRLTANEESHADTSESMPTENDMPGTPSEAEIHDDQTDWKTVYMQQIVDHLSVSMTDIKITIGLNEKDLIVLGSNIELQTEEPNMSDILEDDATSLMQVMSLQSLSAYFVEQSNGESIQLLDGFGYSASIERVSGRRFVDGIMSGLVITGKPRESIQCYLGAKQVDGLLQLRQLLRLVEPDMDISLPEPTGNDRTEESSVLELALPTMSICMEENFQIHFQDGAIQYRTDGSEYILQLGKAFAEMGKEEEQIAVLNNLTVDVINSSVVLSQPKDDDSDTIKVALSLHAGMVERYQNVYLAYSEVWQNKSDTETVAEKVDGDASRNQPWSLDIRGTSKLEISNELGWMHWSMKHVSLTTTNRGKVPLDVTWKSANLSSSQMIMIDVPMMELLDDAVHIRGSIDITVASMDAAAQFSKFLQHCASSYSSEDRSSQSTELLCDIFLPKINAIVLEPDGGMRFECDNLDVGGASLSLRGRSVQVSTLLNGNPSNYFSCRDFHTALDVPDAGEDKQTFKVKIIQMCDMRYLSSVHVPTLSAEATIDPTNMNSLSDMIVNAEEAVLTADFRADNWSKQIESDTESDPILLPNITVSKMNLILHFMGGGIALENAKIGLPEFMGDASTQSDTIAKHYVKLVKKRLPFLLTKANVAGVNVGDSLSSAVATVAVNSSLVGTLVGVVGKDGIGAAITAGKATRGASESERYHFGDFSKGIAASTKNASLSGTAAASSSYASENRVRLSSAVGSGVGMVAGLALAGPVGFVAGSILAGKAVGNAVERRYGDPKKQELDNRTDAGAREMPMADCERPIVRSADSFSTQHSAQSSSQVHLFRPNQSSQSNFFAQADVTAANSDCLPCLGSLPPPTVNDGQQSGGVNNGHTSDVATSLVSQSDSGGGYKLGSITRGIIARGKIARGANKNEGYKFGDFTRGFLG